jgi:hypothetical protein
MEQGVWLLPGKHMMEFRYRSPSTIIGAVLGCLALIVVVWSLCRGAERSRVRWLAMTATIVLCSLLIAVWYYSLYRGSDIGTYYVWTSRQIQPNLSSYYNLAYGKKTEMSEQGVESYMTDNSVGVDGDRDGFFVFLTNTQEQAWWQVNLDANEPIGEIVLYKQQGGYSMFGLPFDVMFSQDGKEWSLIKTIQTDDANNCWRIRVSGIKANYICLQTRYKGLLALSEVEVYRQF